METILWIGAALFLVFVVAVIGATMSGAEKRKLAEETRAAMIARFSLDEAYVSPFDSSCLGIRWDADQLICGKAPDAICTFPFSQLRSSEIELDGATVSKSDATTRTRRGSQVAGAAVGGLAFGPVGLLVGGLTGGNRTTATSMDTTYVRCIALILTVRDRANPIHRITAWEVPAPGIERTNPALKEIVEGVNRYHALMTQIIEDRSNEESSSDALETDVSFELERLWALRQSGALTQAEFDDRKRLLLRSKG